MSGDDRGQVNSFHKTRETRMRPIEITLGADLQNRFTPSLNLIIA